MVGWHKVSPAAQPSAEPESIPYSGGRHSNNVRETCGLPNATVAESSISTASSFQDSPDVAAMQSRPDTGKWLKSSD